MMTEKSRIIAQQQALIHRLSWNQGYGCYTQAGFAAMKWPEVAHLARWIVFFDVNGVHAINEAHGSYEAFNAMMRDVFSHLRSTDVVAGQRNSGDEFVVCILESQDEAQDKQRKEIDPEQMVARLKELLAVHGLTAMFAIREVKSQYLEDSLKPAADEVLAAKKARGVTR